MVTPSYHKQLYQVVHVAPQTLQTMMSHKEKHHTHLLHLLFRYCM